MSLGIIASYLWYTTLARFLVSRHVRCLRCFPVVYLLYFSGQAAMIVRNYLVAAPFFFVLMARGIFWTKSKLPWKKARIGFAIGVLLLIGANALDQAKAAASVARRKDTAQFTYAFIRFSKANSKRTFLISPKLERELKARQFWGQQPDRCTRQQL